MENAIKLSDEQVSNRKKIHVLQDTLESFDEELKTDPPLKHYFAPGMYAREIILPEGVVVVGKIHKHAHLNIISYGHVLVSTYEGFNEFIGPLTFTSAPGAKRAVYALKETMWTTIHLTEKTDLEEIEEEIIAKSYDDVPLLQAQEIKRIES